MQGKDSATATLYAEQALLPEGWRERVRFELHGGAVTRIDTNADPRPGDARHGCILPGLPNVHSHGFQRAMAGLAERRGPGEDSFWTWRETLYRFLDRLTPEDVGAIAALAYLEMLESGFTRVGEFHYLHHAPDGTAYANRAAVAEAIVSAADATGIGFTLLPVFYAHGGFGRQAAAEGQRRFLHDLDGFALTLEASRRAVAKLPDAVLGVAPHSLRAVTPDELAEVAALASGGPIHLHVAEQLREVEDCLAWSGQRPVAWLLDHADVGPNWCLIHATHIEPGEVARMACSGTVVGLCPVTEANLGDGLFPAEAFVGAGGRFGVGSDSNVLIDATEELRLLEYGQRLLNRGRNLLAGGKGESTGGTLYRAAVAGGAQALGVAAGLQPGAPFDAVSLDLDHPSLLGRSGDLLLDGLLFASGRSAIDNVWRRGERVVSGGRHRAGDAVRARYTRVLHGLLA